MSALFVSFVLKVCCLMCNIRFYLFIFLFIVVSLSSTVQAAEDIRGAFGIKFGDFFEKARALSKDEFSGNTVYEFLPGSLDLLFDRYYLSITPRSNRVYGICGIISSGDMAAAKKRHRKLVMELQERHGRVSSGLLSGVLDLFGVQRIEQGDQKIVISFKENRLKTYVIYYDAGLKKLAQREARRLENN